MTVMYNLFTQDDIERANARPMQVLQSREVVESTASFVEPTEVDHYKPSKFAQRPIYNVDPAQEIWIQVHREKAVPGSQLDCFLARFRELVTTEISQELEDFAIPNHVFCSDELDHLRWRDALTAAHNKNAAMLIRFRVSDWTAESGSPAMRDRLTRNDYTAVNLSAYDQSVWGAYLTRHLDHWGCNPYVFTPTNQTEYTALKYGCIPTNICLGVYRSLSDLGELEGRGRSVSHAVTRALVHYLYPLYYSEGEASESVAAAAERLMREESEGAEADE